MKLCIAQEICRHYTNGTKVKDHFVKVTDPCKRWLALTCEKANLLLELEGWITGKPVACNIDKRNRILKELRKPNESD